MGEGDGSPRDARPIGANAPGFRRRTGFFQGPSPRWRGAFFFGDDAMTVLAISGSPSRQSRSRRLLAHGLERLAADGLGGETIDLCEMPADDLLGRTRSDVIERALASVVSARLLLVG